MNGGFEWIKQKISETNLSCISTPQLSEPDEIPMTRALNRTLLASNPGIPGLMTICQSSPMIQVPISSRICADRSDLTSTQITIHPGLTGHRVQHTPTIAVGLSAIAVNRAWRIQSCICSDKSYLQNIPWFVYQYSTFPYFHSRTQSIKPNAVYGLNPL
jgi:hypothetical protein